MEKKNNNASKSSKNSTNKCCGEKTTNKAKKNATMSESACDCALTDYDIASDVLGCQKSLIKLYTTSLCEIDCKKLRSLVTTQMTEASEDQLDTFLYMNDRGMYKTENAPLGKIKTARSKFEKCCKK